MTATPTPRPSGRSGGAHAAEPSLGELVKQVSTSVSDIVQGEIQLAKHELRSSVKNAGVGVGAFVAAAVLLVFALTFGLIALAEGLIALGLYRWLGYLIVFALLMVVIVLLVLIGIRQVKRVKAPQQTIDTGRETVAYLKGHPRTPGSPPAREPIPFIARDGSATTTTSP